MAEATRRVGLLTGTFDPVHLGHVALARAAMSACELTEVWFLVNPAPGHKTGVTPLSNRLAMVELAVQGEAGLAVAEPVPHRMADFERLMGEHPQTAFVFIIGADVLGAMTAWEDYLPAMERASFAVAHRAGVPEAEFSPQLRAQAFELSEHTQASSRTIQRQLTAGERPAELASQVYEYIRRHHLYPGLLH